MSRGAKDRVRSRKRARERERTNSITCNLVYLHSYKFVQADIESRVREIDNTKQACRYIDPAAATPLHPYMCC